MKCIVCVKQVPDTAAQIRIGQDGRSIKTDEILWIMNPYDEYAVEEAIRQKEKFGGEVMIIGLGPKRVAECIRTALAMGADKGIHICDEALEGSDSLSIAKALAAVIKNLEYDLIFTGQKGVDEDQGVVGAALAEFLGIPHLPLVVKMEVDEKVSSIQSYWSVEGQTLVMESKLPALVTVQKGLNHPRFTSLPGIMKAKKKPLELKRLAEIELDASQFGESARKLKLVALTPPPKRKAGKIIDGADPQEKAIKLVRLLRDEAKII